MAKKNQKSHNDGAIRVEISKLNRYPNKYVGVIKEVVKDETNIDEMIGAVAMINAMLTVISIDDEKVRKERDMIIEAYNYAAERMLTSEKNERKILENWFGNYPLLFRIGSVLEFERDKERIDFEYALLADDKKELFKQIMDATWKVREKRRVSLCGDAVQIPRTVRKEELELYYYAVKDRVVSFLLSENDVLTFALERPDGDVISALLKKDGVVEIVDAKRLEHSYSYDAFTGQHLGHPKGEKYVEFNIEL